MKVRVDTAPGERVDEMAILGTGCERLAAELKTVNATLRDPEDDIRVATVRDASSRRPVSGAAR